MEEGLQGSGPKLGPADRDRDRLPGAGIRGQSKAEGQKQEGVIGTRFHLLPFLGMTPAEVVTRGWD